MARYILCNRVQVQGVELKAGREVAEEDADQLRRIGGFLVQLPNPIVEARAAIALKQASHGRREAELDILVAAIAEFMSNGQVGEDVQAVPFSYATTSPMTLRAVLPGSSLNRADILILQAFDDGASTLSLGTSADPSAIIPASNAMPNVLGQYQTTEITPFVVPDLLQFYISPGSSTQGAGILLFKVKG